MHCYFNNKMGKATFIGFCIDSGASETVCGREQWRAYVETLPEESLARKEEHSFRFGQTVYLFKEACPVFTMLPNNAKIAFEVLAIDLKVPFLLGLDVLDRFGIVLDFGT